MRGVRLLLAGVLAFGSQAAYADVSVFVANVSFDDDANLEPALGFGLRWGKSSGFIAGETSLLIARPDREIAGSAEAATAFFYDGRFLVNIPVGQLKPFIGVGFGAITVTSTDLPSSTDNLGEEALDALNTVADLQTNSAFSYGGGIRYALNDRVDARIDLRQYQVFSVRSAVATRVASELEGVTGETVDKELTDESTVQYNEISAGIVFRF
ncbi:MAG: outer membrane beta-barrel protein [Candidatus Latescibacterota bacterium]|nr:outer membrane beta-barrel protein [Candidatus Latescibacterota bacterium]